MRKARVLAAGVIAVGIGVAGATVASGSTGRAARAASSVVVVGQEGKLTCLNPEVATCLGALVDLVEPILRGAYLQTPSWQYKPDLVSTGRATRTTLSFTIRQNADWYWGGRKLPVTYRDFVYTWKAIVDPKNPISVADRPVYQGITGYTHRGLKQITFHWTKPVGRWKTLFYWVYPSAALQGMRFATMWRNCVCGNDGKPVSSGPFYLASRRNDASVLEPNPYWYGRKPALTKVVVKPLLTQNAEVAALRNGTVDIVSPTSSFSPVFAYGKWLTRFLHIPGVVYTGNPSVFNEHIDMQYGVKGNPLLSASWFRQAIAMGIDREAVINASYGPLAAGLRPLDDLLYMTGDVRSRPDFARWPYDPARALALLKQHCTGGPETPQPTTAVWTCSGVAANLRFLYEKTNPFRAAGYRVMHAELARIGIALGDDGVTSAELFGANGVSSSDWDLAEFAWGAFDPSGFAPDWTCNGPLNYLNYCNHAVTGLMQAGTDALDVVTQERDFQRADALLAADVPTIPLYVRPWPLVRAARLQGVKSNPDQMFDWNIEDWRWAR